MIPLESYTLESEFIDAAAEWSVLLTLAALPHPALALSENDWRAGYFASPGAHEAFARIERAEKTTLLSLPPGLSGAGSISETAELARIRERLIKLTQWRIVARLGQDTVQEVRQGIGKISAEESGDPEALLEALGDALEKAWLATTRRSASLTLLQRELITTYWERIARQSDALPTGLGKLDEALGGGLQEGRLLLLLGGPGSGKTTLANQIAEHVAAAGNPVVYLTLEDTAASLLAKTVARIGRLEYGAVIRGAAAQRQAIDRALLEVARRRSSNLLRYIEDSGLISLERLRGQAQAHFEECGGAGLIVVDYLQRWARGQRETQAGAGRELREVVSAQLERLRGIARELRCSVLAISSQNRLAGYGVGGNVLTSAKESGDLEYGCDVLAALGDEPVQSGQLAEGHSAKVLALAKNRQGATGSVSLDWYPAQQQFTGLQQWTMP